MGMDQRDIEALSTYLGSDPRPADFEAFWSARMAEADAVPLEWRVEPADVPSCPSCAYYDLWFAGMGGATLYAKYVRPRGDGPLPLVLQFHGYPGASRSWFEQSSFAGMGCALLALDNPGQGGRSEDVGGFRGTTVAGHLVAGAGGSPEGLYYVRLYQDVRILCRIVRAMGEEGAFDLSRVFVNGASQGGGMGVACCALNPGLVSRAAILYPFLSDFRKVSELDADEVAYEGLRYWSRWFDPDGTHADALFGKLAYYDTKNFAGMVRCPVQFGTGLADTICPPETQCAVYNGLSCERRRLLFPGFGHEEIAAFDDATLRFFGEEIGEGVCGATAPEVGGGCLDLGNACARYRELTVPTDDGVGLVARFVRPADRGPRPLVLHFSDTGRSLRGWHHLTRFVAIGFSVLHVACRCDGRPDTFARGIADASCVLDAALGLPGVDEARLVAFGEGVGGALALAMASERRLWKVAALNPYPIAPLVGHVPHVSCAVLMGSSGMDALSPAAEQDGLASLMPQVVHRRYPKYAHERINAFEDELLRFLCG